VKEVRLAEVNRALEDPKVWDDPKRAQELGREKKTLDLVVQKMHELAAGVRDAGELFEMARSDDDDATLHSVEADVTALGRHVADLEFQRMFNNPLDPNNCFIEIQAGAGGTEAQDWAGMLERMYLRYAERRGFKPELLDESAGEVAEDQWRLRLRHAAYRDRHPPAGAQVAI
jgi:peptide chain release factor 2